ncbi:GNAT family N-acetyltransferase [Crateriforma spongiae]|uniref:GNAT family N-acetyltransferase n=1 Tax=Crateriforma spongiae TaxID=2724528 RepID=UPI001447C772|nr:N-acetyltransferase [Crateriforma spongiae]
MNANQITIRQSDEHDRDEILAVHLDAFGNDEGPVIATLVDQMFDDATGKPIYSLVAEADERIIGHVLFTAVTMEPAATPLKHQILAPLAVVNEQQGRGIGGRLVRDGFRRLADDGVDLVFVLGDPDYYSRFGFKPAGVRGFQAPHPIPDQHAGAWMVHELETGVIDSCGGTVKCCNALNDRKHWIE